MQVFDGFLAGNALAKKTLGEPCSTQLIRFGKVGLFTVTDDEFAATATDVDSSKSLLQLWHAPENPQVNEPALLLTGNHSGIYAKFVPDALEKLMAVS